MSIIKKLIFLIILILFFILWKYLPYGNLIGLNYDLLLTLGFLFIAGYALGELAALIGLPKLTGYLITGIIFGPYSHNFFTIDILRIFSDNFINDLRFVVDLSIAIIAISIGRKINLKELQSEKKLISSLILSQFLIVSIPVSFLFIIFFPLLGLIESVNFSSLILLGGLSGILMLSTSPIATVAIINEEEKENKFTKFVLDTVVLKEIILLILIGLFLLFSKWSFQSFNEKSISLLSDFSIELIHSLIIGIITGYIVIGYFKLIKSDKMIFILALIIAFTALSKNISLNLIIVFGLIGFIIRNFSDYDEELKENIDKLILPASILFFTVAGASFNLTSFSIVIPSALIIFSLRLIFIFLSISVAVKFAGESDELRKNLWTGFISQSMFPAGLAVVIYSLVPSTSEAILSFIESAIILNLLAGPILFRIGIKNFNTSLDKTEEKATRRIIKKLKEEAVPTKKFQVPQFEDQNLNQLVLSLREKLLSYLTEFEHQLLAKRIEESLEFYYQIVEKYIDEYQQLKNQFIKSTASGKEIKKQVILIQQEISEWFARISVERKVIEQQIVNAEYLLNKLFSELKEYCETVPEYVTVEQEEDKYSINSEDKLPIRIVKYFKQSDKRLRKILGIKKTLRRKIPYVTLVKYYFEYQIALEMEKVAFFIGLERLNVLKKVKKIYDDVNSNLEELIHLITENKDIASISLVAIDKLDEIHQRLKQEISSIGEEIESSNQNINTRLNYAFANPFNQFLKSLKKAGTFELNIKKFHFSKIYKETEKAKETTLQTIRFWINYLIGFLGICERDARVYEITGKINLLINDLLLSYSDNIISSTRNLIEELNKKLKLIESELKSSYNLRFANISQLIENIENYREDIIQKLNEKGITKLTSLKKTYKVYNTINSIKENFNQILKSYYDEIKVLDDKDFELKETKTRYIELKILHFKSIIRNFFEKEIIQEIIKFSEIVNAHLSSSIFELKNIENIIFYHFNITIEELNKLQSNPAIINPDYELQRIIDDTLKTSIKLLREKLRSWEHQIERFEREVELSLAEKIYGQISGIKEDFRRELTAELEKRIELTKIQKTFNLIYHNTRFLSSRLKRLFNRIKRLLNSSFKFLVREVKEFLEVDLEGKSVAIYSYDQTVYDEAVYNSLPFIYKKLFDYETSEITEILVGRDRERALLLEAYNRTQKGLAGSTAIIGESGTGKSSLINLFLNNVSLEDVVLRYTFEKTIRDEKELLKVFAELLGIKYVTSFDEIVGELSFESKYRVVILEDIHKIFLRKYGGLEAMKKLLLVISETSDKVFWIITISYHAWQLLNRILNISNYFVYQIKTEVLTKEQIKEAILKRHKTSGFELEFLPEHPFAVHKNLKYSLLAVEKQKVLEEIFFDRLYNACEGNITSALFYWMKSIKEFRNNKVYIMPFKKLDLRFLELMEIDKLLTLSNLIQHGSLTLKEHSEVFKVSIEKSKAILNFLHNANLVHFDINEDGDKVFYINPPLYKPIEIVLRKLHIFD